MITRWALCLRLVKGGRLWLAVAAARQELELLGPPDRCPAVVHAELAEDVPGVGTHGIQGDHELPGNVGAVQIASEQPKHFQLAFAQRLDQAFFDGRSVLSSVLSLAKGRQKS